MTDDLGRGGHHFSRSFESNAHGIILIQPCCQLSLQPTIHERRSQMLNCAVTNRNYLELHIHKYVSKLSRCQPRYQTVMFIFSNKKTQAVSNTADSWLQIHQTMYFSGLITLSTPSFPRSFENGLQSTVADLQLLTASHHHSLISF